MVKTQRVREWCLDCLSEGSKTTQELLDYVRKKSRHGSDRHVLCNVLAKDKRIIKLGHVKRQCATSLGKYNVVLWGIRPGVEE